MSGIRINLSSEAAASEAKDSTPMPAGKYLFNITEVTEEACGPNSKNPGKPYYRMEITVEGGQYEGRRVWSNVMCFGDSFLLVQLLKSQGIAFAGDGSFHVEDFEPNTIPDPEWFYGRSFVGRVILEKGKKRPDGDGMYPDKNELKGIWPATEGVSASRASSRSTNLLP